ncbi:phospholipase D family protein [Aeromonas veronii]|uniref:phospholipase D family protein n=1 Tax=Aeromonas veronii TaxID=654 RepID=UPI003BA1F579
MFLYSENYLEQVKLLAGSSQNLSLAVAFWGNGAEKLFDDWQGGNLKILCNLSNGGTNPHTVRQLMALQGAEVRQANDLHAKVMLGESAALIGSANFSANGLGYEGSECSGWQEAGVRIDAPSQLASIRTWFDRMWEVNRGNTISDQDLLNAQVNWNKKRTAIPEANVGARLLEQSLSAIKGRPIYLAIYRCSASEKALQDFESVKEKVQQAGGRTQGALDFFEDWPDEGNNSLPKDGQIICVYSGTKGSVRVENIWKRAPALDTGNIQILTRESLAGSWALERGDQDTLAKRLKPWLDTLNLNLEENARCLRLDAFLEWEISRNEHNGS